MRRRGRLLAVAVLGILAFCGGFFWARPVSVFRVFNEAQMYLEGGRNHFTVVNGYRIHYYTLGPESGSPVVLVHGLGGRAEDWEKLAPYLRKAGYRVYLPDLPGFVQLVAAKNPDRVQRLMLFDSAGLYLRPEWDTKLFTPISPAEIEKLDNLLMPHPPTLPDFVARDIVRVSQEHAWVMHRSLDTMLQGRETTDALLPRLTMPVLIVWGEADQITPLGEGEKIHKLIPQSQFEVVKGCGHLAPNECAKEIGPAVVRFLEQVH